MNITFLIGNGFDRALGLHTDYESFIKAYVLQKEEQVRKGVLESDSPLVKICEDMKRNPKTWADAERAFGKLKFSGMGTSPIAVYDKCYDDFVESFDERIRAENERFLSGKQVPCEMRDAFLTSLLRLDKHIVSSRQMPYLDYLCSMGDVVLNFIDFNYTDTLQFVLDATDGGPAQWEEKVPHDRVVRAKMGSICHVHGSFANDDIVFGVDNDAQVLDENVRDYCRLTGGLLKAKVDENTRAGHEREAVRILKSSQLIVLYGLSFGETDMSWWSRVFDMVVGGRARLVVCPYCTKHLKARNAKKRCDLAAQPIRDVFRAIRSKPNVAGWLVFPDPSKSIALETYDESTSSGEKRHCDYFGLGKIGEYVLNG